MIKNLVFDLGNVIVDLDYSTAFAPLGIPSELFENIYNTDFFHTFEKGEVTEDDFFNFLCDGFSFKCKDIPILKKTLHQAFPLRPKVWKMLEALKSSHHIFMLSNTNILDFGSLEEQYPLREPFEKVYLSYEQGHRKPDASTWVHAENFFNINSEETLFLDDRIENIEAAAKHGWDTIHVLSEKQLFESLLDRHIISKIPKEND
ncbi:MAG: HAD family phosphatase [Candidatus Marinimicrobia bacterium]|nr:HAD family phosphatase [Candidatus Neomarinimicrobiota bacterium]